METGAEMHPSTSFPGTPVDRALLELLACALHDQRPHPSVLEGVDGEELLRESTRHSLAAMVCMSLEKMPFPSSWSDALVQQWMEKKHQAIRRDILLYAERQQVEFYLESHGIWHMALKGSVLRQWYPRLGMREMGDCDILYDAAYQKVVREFFEARGYQVERYKKGCHDEYHKPPMYNFEMHTGLFSDGDDRCMSDYYRFIRKQLILDAGCAYRVHFSDESFYVYLLAHMYKHVQGGGTGLRSLVDVSVGLSKLCNVWNEEEICRQTRRLGLFDFERTIRSLAVKTLVAPRCMSAEQREESMGTAVGPMTYDLSEEEQRLLKDLFASGVYGSVEHQIEKQLTALQQNDAPFTAATRRRYYWQRMFPGIRWMKDHYPFCDRHPWALPLFWLWRPIRCVFVSRKHVRAEMRAIRNLEQRK